jgi:hypothetical protein
VPAGSAKDTADFAARINPLYRFDAEAHRLIRTNDDEIRWPESGVQATHVLDLILTCVGQLPK